MKKDYFLPYLGLKIITTSNVLTFGIETNTDSYIKREAFNPVSQKHAIFNSLTFKLVSVPLSNDEFNKEYKIIRYYWQKWLPKTNDRQKKVKFKKQQEDPLRS